MAKKPYSNDDMELQALKSEMALMNRRMEEVITILGGNSAYGVVGMKNDVRDLKADVSNIKQEIEKMKREDSDREKRQGFLSIKLDTIPQKIVAFVAFIAVVISVAQGLKSLFTHQ